MKIINYFIDLKNKYMMRDILRSYLYTILFIIDYFDQNKIDLNTVY